MATNHPPPTHPGRILQNQFIDTHKISLEELSSKLNLPEEILESFIAGKVSLSPVHLFELTDVLETSPEFWFDLQEKWEKWQREYFQQVRKKQLSDAIVAILHSRKQGELYLAASSPNRKKEISHFLVQGPRFPCHIATAPEQVSDSRTACCGCRREVTIARVLHIGDFGSVCFDCLGWLSMMFLDFEENR